MYDINNAGNYVIIKNFPHPCPDTVRQVMRPGFSLVTPGSLRPRDSNHALYDDLSVCLTDSCFYPVNLKTC